MDSPKPAVDLEKELTCSVSLPTPVRKETQCNGPLFPPETFLESGQDANRVF